MANKKSARIPVNKEKFLSVLHEKNKSLRSLNDDEAYEIIQLTDKPIRRYLNEGAMPPDVLNRIAKYLDVHPDYLSGLLDSKADAIEDRYIRYLCKKTTTAEHNPYVLKAASDIDYKKHFEDILMSNYISLKQFNSLPPLERVYLRQEMVVAILRVLAQHFKTDALGNDTKDRLNYCESYEHDYDPSSYFAQLEGIGMTEDKLFNQEQID